MNKLATALCLTSALMACSSAQATAIWHSSGNWLVGLSGGLTHDRSELNVTTSSTLNGSPTGLRQTVVSPRFQDDGWFLGLLAGYQWRCNRWLLGIEGNLDWYDNGGGNNDFAYTDANNRGWSATSDYDRDWVLGLSGRLGYGVTEWLMAYGRVGLEYSDDELNYTQFLDNAAPFNVNASESQDSLRVFAGLGLEMPLPISNWDCLSLRAEYDYHDKGKRVQASGVSTSAASAEWASAGFKPYTQTFFVSLVYNFVTK